MGDDVRRGAALAVMEERFPAVEARVWRVYGLRLPRHVAVFCAFWASACAAERAALDHLMIGPFGLTEYFGDFGLQLTSWDGLDERLHGRYRYDPPEFVTVLSGGSDGTPWRTLLKFTSRIVTCGLSVCSSLDSPGLRSRRCFGVRSGA